MKSGKYCCVETNLFGPGSLALLGDELRKRRLERAFIVTDKSLVKAGVVKKVEAVLSKAGIAYAIYDEVAPNPSVSIINAAFDAYRLAGSDFIIAVGGGSPIDTSKAIGILASNGGEIEQYEGVNKSIKRSVSVVAVNTTAGTGSEVTAFYVITDDKRHSKMVMVDSNCIVAIAVNDPELMLSMPAGLTAATGMDALTHAVEAFLSVNATPFTDKDALWAISIVKKFLPRAVKDGFDLEARNMMAYAEYAAGMAFSNSGLGMVHAMAHSLGGFYGLPHGVCNAVLLPYVMEYNGIDKEVQKRMRDIAAALDIKGAGWMVPYRATLEAVADIRKLSKALSIPQNLSLLGVKEQDLEALANLALTDTCMPSNPRKATLQELVEVYKKAFK